VAAHDLSKPLGGSYVLSILQEICSYNSMSSKAEMSSLFARSPVRCDLFQLMATRSVRSYDEFAHQLLIPPFKIRMRARPSRVWHPLRYLLARIVVIGLFLLAIYLLFKDEILVGWMASPDQPCNYQINPGCLKKPNPRTTPSQPPSKEKLKEKQNNDLENDLKP
jgi:hypothetical protein